MEVFFYYEVCRKRVKYYFFENAGVICVHKWKIPEALYLHAVDVLLWDIVQIPVTGRIKFLFNFVFFSANTRFLNNKKEKTQKYITLVVINS